MKAKKNVPGPGQYPNPDQVIDKFSLAQRERIRQSMPNAQSLTDRIAQDNRASRNNLGGVSSLSNYASNYAYGLTRRNPISQRFLTSNKMPKLPKDRVRFPGPG